MKKHLEDNFGDSRDVQVDESRRKFLKNVSIAGAGVLALQFADGTEVFAEVPEYVSNPVDALPLKINVNGMERSVSIDARTSLLDTLREHLDLTGSKKGCDHGQCGACTVIIDGKRQLSCLTLAVMCDGKRITTIEGLADGDKLHPVQQAFLDHDGFQCGYCTPGQICSAVAMLGEAKNGDASQVTQTLRPKPQIANFQTTRSARECLAISVVAARIRIFWLLSRRFTASNEALYFFKSSKPERSDQTFTSGRKVHRGRNESR